MTCQSGCCGRPSDLAAGGGTPPDRVVAQADDLEDPRPGDERDATCESGSEGDSCPDGCGTDDRHDEEEARPDCCAGQPLPCCDDACLDRVALRECEKAQPSCGDTEDAGSVYAASGEILDGQGAADARPCRRHARSVRARYQATLDALGCICRALLALGQESCCPPRAPPSSAERRRSRKRTSAASSTPAPPDSCCATGTCAGASSAALRPRPHRLSARASAASSCAGDDCCSAQAPKSPYAAVQPCHDGGCGETLSRRDPTGADLEKGSCAADEEHVVLAVSGMTCTGCETKLRRTLARVDGLSHLQTSLVLARVEFDVRGGPESVRQVLDHLARTTEFTYERLASHDHGGGGGCRSVDLIVTGGGDPQGLVDGVWPPGVAGVTALDAKTVRVDFDPRVVGARDLVERGWGGEQVTLAPPRPDASLEAGCKHVRHMGRTTLLSAVLTIPVLVMAWAPLPRRAEMAYASASLALATVVQLAVAGPFYPRALKALVFSRVVEMDLLVVLSTSAAYVFSVVAFACLAARRPLPAAGQFFETSTLLVTLIVLGRYVASLARQKAVESISIHSLQTATALLVVVDGRGTETEREVDARLLQYGDVFRVPPGGRVPTDGTVVAGSSEVDESLLTGESAPVAKRPGSTVVAGSVNCGSGRLAVRLTRLPGANTISAIADMVDQARLSKPRMQAVADRVAAWFVPCAAALSLVTFAAWVGVGVAVRGQAASEAVVVAVTYAVAVLIVSCPCAVGLAVPMVVVMASGLAAERGVVFKAAHGIEVAHRAAHVAFDKTGTLTEGRPSVVREQYFGRDKNKENKENKENHENGRADVQSLLLGLVGGVPHPVSRAIVAHLRAAGVAAAADVTDVRTHTGQGVEGTASSSGRVLRAGHCRWLGVADDDPRVAGLLEQGHTVFCFAVDGALRAVFALRDTLRAQAVGTVSRLQEEGVAVHLLSGDDEGAVRSAAAQLGIPAANVRARCSPADKQAYIRSLQTCPSRSRSAAPSVVLFCGDGTNDAAALAQATVGIHIASSASGSSDDVGDTTATVAAVARSAADVVLLRPDPAGVRTAMAISRLAARRVVFNLAWSAAYNVGAVLLAAGALVRVRVAPAYAGLGELVSVLPVVAAAVTMRWARV